MIINEKLLSCKLVYSSLPQVDLVRVKEIVALVSTEVILHQDLNVHVQVGFISLLALLRLQPPVETSEKVKNGTMGVEGDVCIHARERTVGGEKDE